MLFDRLFLPPPLYRWKDPFATTVPMQAHFQMVKHRPAAEFRFVILFTPRSGSSFLTDLIQGTGVLGDAGEVFNPPIAWDVAGAMGCTSLEDYVDSLVRARNMSGVFSAELIWTHLDFMFGSPKRFVELVQPSRYVWLTRQDYVAQAVSISNMMQTGVTHAPNATPDEIAQARAAVSYDGKQIERIVKRMIWMEMKTEVFFRDFQIAPLRLTYEEITQAKPAEVLRTLIAHLGRDVQIDEAARSDHTKLSGAKSTEFAERFRHEHSRLIRRLDRVRARYAGAT